MFKGGVRSCSPDRAGGLALRGESFVVRPPRRLIGDGHAGGRRPEARKKRASNNSAWTSVSRGGSLQAESWHRTWEATAPGMMADGAISREEHELYVSTITGPTFRYQRRQRSSRMQPLVHGTEPYY